MARSVKYTIGIRDQCAAAQVAFFFKQWGEWIGRADGVPADEQDGECHEWPEGGASIRIGKKRAGRLLDGREWNEYPAARVAA